jgi:hypothetical protein
METAHDIFHTIEPVFNKHKTTPHVECELRLGRFVGKRFDANVGETIWRQVVAALEKYQGWESSTTSASEVYYKGDLRMTVDGETDEQELYRKRRVSNTELKLNNRPLDARFSVSTEEPVNPETLGEDDEWDQCRCRKRKSFVRKNLRIDCTVVTGGDVDPDAEDDTEYQVEMEIIDPTKVGDRDTAFNIFYKLQDILTTIK